MRKDGVKALLRIAIDGTPQTAIALNGQQHEQGEAGRQGQRQGEAVALIEFAHGRWPSVIGISLTTDGGHGLGHVDGKLMRRRILTSMQTRTAVVAQVSQVMNVGLAKFQAPRHGGKHGTKTFAIATAIANLKLSRNFLF